MSAVDDFIHLVNGQLLSNISMTIRWWKGNNEVNEYGENLQQVMQMTVREIQDEKDHEDVGKPTCGNPWDKGSRTLEETSLGK
ncbi:hypothetical protein AVEN_88383-1 [Araneus ventricosus]|uniref:Uncharacterized protein n=1 Tax=Araneus ventricosus TaxID=182803 RepID=A0A4Y2GI91_ARAVE|nr:hypothetical protein AVEN_88383-1 [Araneus ventricosus]